MKPEEILRLAIEKAEKNGFSLKSLRKRVSDERDDNYRYLKNDDVMISNLDIYEIIIFSHEFAKAFFGEEIKDSVRENDIHWTNSDAENINTLFIGYNWQHHLQQMVLEEKSIQYLEQFLK